MNELKRNFLRLGARVSGLIALLMGVGLIALAIAIAYKQLSFYGVIPLGAMLAVFALASIGLFCLIVGYRLLLNRSTKYNSLLSPIGWYATSAAFTCAAVVVAVVILRSHNYGDLRVVLAPIFLALACAHSAKEAKTPNKNEDIYL